MKYIYNYERKLEKLKETISRDLSKANQKILQDFENQIEIEELSLPRKLKLLDIILILVRDYFKKDLDKVTKTDIKDAVIKIQKRNISVWTKEGYRVIIVADELPAGGGVVTSPDNCEGSTCLKVGIEVRNSLGEILESNPMTIDPDSETTATVSFENHPGAILHLLWHKQGQSVFLRQNKTLPVTFWLPLDYLKFEVMV